MIDGLSHLMTIRRSGHRPHAVMLTIDGPYIKPKYANELHALELVAHESVANDDFRPFKGLTVTLYAGTWSQLADDTLEKLKQYADEIAVLCADYGDDIGYFWTKECGAIDFDDYRWVRQFHKARVTGCSNKTETDARCALEKEALEHIPDMMKRYFNFSTKGL